MPTAAGAGDRRETSKVRSGAEVLAADGFDRLRGRRIGLIANHTSRVGNERLVDVMARTQGLDLARILTPEHGLSGTAEAGAKVTGGVDPATGVPIASLYGATLKPSPRMLDGLDVLVFDMQDIGVRYYTYISTMGLAMQAAAAAKLPFVVLDRPNPLGGETVSGFTLDKRFASFVGRFAIPQIHGLSAGELARVIKGERLLDGLGNLVLDVVRCDGWRRDMLWPATGRDWVATSPNIPTFETALAYAGTGLFEATTASEGRGTDAPFLLIGHMQASGARIAEAINGARLPGVRFAPRRVTPRAIAGVATAPRFRGQPIEAVALTIDDHRSFRPLDTAVHLLVAFEAELAAKSHHLVADARTFNRLAGGDRLAGLLQARTGAAEIVAAWAHDVRRFREQRAPYLLY